MSEWALTPPVLVGSGGLCSISPAVDMRCRVMTPSVLLIENNAAVADAMGLVLRSAGYDTVICFLGRDGLRLIAERQFQLILTDLLLPDVSCFEILNACRSTHESTQVIITMANATRQIQAEMLENGAFAMLAKPFTPSELIKLVETALERSRP
ncbi:MAG TPA: response regulator [Blastocatellia bacterium]|nr:response regulator [Blastocatellia bacterium]